MRVISRLTLPLAFALLFAAGSALEAQCSQYCTESSSCTMKCTDDDGSLITCGQYGVCRPPCSYVQTTPYTECLIEYDNHIWGNRLEMHAEALLADADGKSYCPDRWVTKVVRRKDCSLTQNVFDCCLGAWGNVCYALWIPGRCH